MKTGKKYVMDPMFVYSLYSQIIYHSCATEDEIHAKTKKNLF